MRAFDPDLVRRTMKAKKVSQADLAGALGLAGQSAVSALLAGKRKVSVDEAAAIYALLELDIPARERAVATPPVEPPAALPDYAVVPVIGMAGAGKCVRRVGVDHDLDRLAGRAVFGIAVSGDSMDLLIEDGGLILVDAAQKELVPGGVFLIANSAGEATVKRYRRDPARFEPCSSNPLHQPFLVSDDDFRIVGKVVWKSAPVL